jgi:hypothetical protein
VVDRSKRRSVTPGPRGEILGSETPRFPDQGQNFPDVPVPVIEGLAPRVFRCADYDQAIELLLQVRFDLWPIGGHHAHRDVVGWMVSGTMLCRLRTNVWGPVRAAPRTSAFFGVPRPNVTPYH